MRENKNRTILAYIKYPARLMVKKGTNDKYNQEKEF